MSGKSCFFGSIPKRWLIGRHEKWIYRITGAGILLEMNGFTKAGASSYIPLSGRSGRFPASPNPARKQGIISLYAVALKRYIHNTYGFHGENSTKSIGVEPPFF